MTVSTESNKAGPFAGNGVTVDFDFDFEIYAESDLRVVLADSDGNETVQTLSSDYTISSSPWTSGGTVTMNTAPANGETLVIKSDLPLTQETDYESNDPFPADSHERALDRLVKICQQISEQVSRAIIAGETAGDISFRIPAPGALKFLRWNTDADALENAALPLIRTGNGAPASSLGIDADLYLALDSGDIYGPKSGGAWGSPVANIKGAADAAEAAEAKAEKWAEEAEDVEVETGQYSAKHHALKSAASASASATSETNAAASESAASASASAASTSETNAAGSASAASTSEAKAEKWAEENEDVEVETGKYSAKHYASKAATFDPDDYYARYPVPYDIANNSYNLRADIDVNEFVTSIGVNRTIGLTNTASIPVGAAWSATLRMAYTSGTVTWNAVDVWAGGSAPTLTSGKTYLVMFHRDENGLVRAAAMEFDT